MLRRQHIGQLFHTSRTFMATALDLEGRYLYANPAFCEEFNFDAEHLAGQPFQTTLHPDDVAVCLEAAQGVLQSRRGSTTVKIRKSFPTGECYWTRWEFFPLFDNEGDQAAGIFCLGYNTTNWEKAEQNLEKRIRFQQILMRLATDFVNAPLERVQEEIQQMLQTVGQFVNSDRVYVFDYDFVGQTASNTYEWCAEGIEPEIANLQEVPLDAIPDWVGLHLMGQIMYIPSTANLPEDDGMRMILEPQGIQSLITLPLVDKGKCAGFIGFDAVRHERQWDDDEIALLRVLAELLANVRARQRASEELLQLNTNLERRIEERTAELLAINEELEAFSYSVSHDLKTPLRHIRSFLELIRRKIEPQMDDELRHDIQYVMNAAGNMGGIIEELLGFSRVSKQALLKKPLDMEALAKGVFQELEPERQGREIILDLRLLPHKVEADPLMMKLLWVNLLSNAIKYTRTRAQARIMVDNYQEGSEVVFRIRDNGVGFDMQFYDRLFTAFQRLHTREEFEGTGIGLATSKRIVQKHGGRIWAEGWPEEGAVFYFSLP